MRLPLLLRAIPSASVPISSESAAAVSFQPGRWTSRAVLEHPARGREELTVSPEEQIIIHRGTGLLAAMVAAAAQPEQQASEPEPEPEPQPEPQPEPEPEAVDSGATRVADLQAWDALLVETPAVLLALTSALFDMVLAGGPLAAFALTAAAVGAASRLSDRYLSAQPALAAALVIPAGKRGGRPWPPPSGSSADVGPPVMSFKRLLDQLVAVSSYPTHHTVPPVQACISPSLSDCRPCHVNVPAGCRTRATEAAALSTASGRHHALAQPSPPMMLVRLNTPRSSPRMQKSAGRCWLFVCWWAVSTLAESSGRSDLRHALACCAT